MNNISEIWEQNYRKLSAWIQSQNAGMNAAPMPEELSTWIQSQRVASKNVSDEMVQKLESLPGFTWESR